MIAEFRRVCNKETVLFGIAEAAVDHPDERVREALYKATPVVLVSKKPMVLVADLPQFPAKGTATALKPPWS